MRGSVKGLAIIFQRGGAIKAFKHPWRQWGEDTVEGEPHGLHQGTVLVPPGLSLLGFIICCCSGGKDSFTVSCPEFGVKMGCFANVLNE